jgi:hypothetical protein
LIGKSCLVGAPPAWYSVVGFGPQHDARVTAMNPLQVRLAALRRRLRLVITFRGACWLLAILLIALALTGLLDWWVPGHLPSLVRAILLSAALAVAGYVAYRYLVSPLQASADDLSLALRVEAHYPILNDALGSAVQFLEEPTPAAEASSPSLRRKSIERALGFAGDFDFRAVVNSRGMGLAGLSTFASGLLVLVLALAYPQPSWTALLRFADPFGGHDWPLQTQLSVQARDRIARGELFEIRASVSGVIPERAIVAFRFTGGTPFEQGYAIGRDGPAGSFVARMEAGRIQHDFDFQVRANDATVGWSHVEVLPPPQLVPLDGRPSPQVHVRPPAYTDVPEQDLPDGTSSIEAAAGTQVRVRAAVDRPIVRAWLEYPGDLQPLLSELHAVTAVSTSVAPLPLFPATGIALLSNGGSASLMQFPAEIDGDGQVLTLDFPARISGTFALHFEDDRGISNSRLLEIHAVMDPAPVVHIERPARSQDSLDILPDAEVTLHVQAEDLTYAIRSVYLEHRQKGSDGAAAEPGHLMLYDHEVLERALPRLLPMASLRGSSSLRLRSPRLDIERRWSLAGLHLQEGDVVTLRACADDFDDVTVGKKPGCSEEVELRVVGRDLLDNLLDRAQAQIEQEIARLRKEQQEALEKVIPAERQWANQSPLEPKHLDDLIQAEQIQEQMRTRVGTRVEGLRAQVARVLQTTRDNHFPRSSTQDRMESVQNELDRLAREELDQIEPRLTEARKAQELNPGKAPQRSHEKLLSEARKHQDEIEKTLGELLKLLEPWTSTHEVKAEARSILQEQRKLQEDTAKLAKDLTGKDMPDLAPSEKGKLEETSERQNKLAERTAQMLEKLERLAAEKAKAQDADAAQQLRDAAKRGRDTAAAERMQEATRNIQNNQLAEAGNRQNASIKAMEDVTRTLEDRREEELDRLVKKMKDAERRLADLAQRQEELRKKARQASQTTDPAKRQEELKRLARAQEQLEKETQETVRELSRLRMERARQALTQASGRMQRAGRQMDQAGNPEGQQEEALDRLNEAQREVQQARQEAEEELARERLAKVADQIKGLKERQTPLSAEAARIHRSVLENKQWTRPLAASMRQLAEAQAGLGDEAQRLATDKLEAAKVFSRLLHRSAESMKQASERMRRRLDQALERTEKTPEGEEPSLDLPAEQLADAETQQAMSASDRRLELLLDALKPEASLSLRAGRANGGQGGGGGGGSGRGGGASDAIPALAQYKALRALQEEINDRTKLFSKQHPDPKNLSAKDRDQLQGLHQEQQELEELFHEITAPAKEEESSR